jgi:hypothetical protein
MTTPDPNTCLRCGGTIQSAGVEQLRVGGTSGGWKLMFGEWAELGEEMIALEMFACATCRHVEFRLPAPPS